MIRIGSSFHVPGIRFRSDPAGIVFAADLRRGTLWTARTAGRSLPPGAPREDGSAARIEWAAGEKRRAFAAKLFISTSFGIAGFGPLSDQTALALENAAAGILGVEKENLISAAAGPVLEHYPVGSMMEALQSARSQPALDEPLGRNVDALGLPFRIAEGALDMSAAVFHSERTGGEVWIAAASAGIGREVLEGVRDRLWLAGPAAWRASSGIHPGDALILLATGASPIAEVASEEDPRTESVIAGLSTALAQLVRKRAPLCTASGARACADPRVDRRNAALFRPQNGGTPSGKPSSILAGWKRRTSDRSGARRLRRRLLGLKRVSGSGRLVLMGKARRQCWITAFRHRTLPLPLPCVLRWRELLSWRVLF